MEVSWAAEHGMSHSDLLSWDDEDRAKLVAYLLENSERCQMCGTAPWEWDDDRNAYEPISHQCWGCYVKDGADQGDSLPGSRITLVPRKQAERLRNKENRAPRLRQED